ncbi:MAG: PhoU family transcriptional regulator [Chloroflexota bacterium]|nr:PhoU family transcriptional regulator [Chloroflexota bacterium]
MPRTVLDRELQELHTHFLQLGSLVEKALAEALTSLETSDFTTFQMVVEADTSIDNLRTAIEEHVIRLLAMQQPLAGRDLRYLTASLSIAASLERIGDGAAGIAEISLRMPQPPSESNNAEEHERKTSDRTPRQEEDAQGMEEATIMKHLLELGTEAQRVLQETLRALAHDDTEAAKQLREEDELVDRRYETVQHELMHILATAPAIPALQHDTSFLQRVAYLLWIAHKLERIADHATKICKKLIYIVEG